MHTCMQGWTGIAKWSGPKVMDVMALAGERAPEAAYLMVTSFGLAQKMHGGRPLQPYYSCIPLADCLEDESIFAWSICACALSPSTATRWSSTFTHWSGSGTTGL